MSEFSVPHSRPYIHVACGSTTIVSGSDFATLANPLRLVSATFCANCNKHFPLGQFMWADTGETIPAARERLADKTPAIVKTLNSDVGCWISFAVGAGIGACTAWLFGSETENEIGIGAGVGALAFPIVWQGFLVPAITKWVYGWNPQMFN